MSDALREIIELEKSGYRATAVRRLRDYLHQHREDAQAWYYLARFSVDPHEQKRAIQSALLLQPDQPDYLEFQAILLEEHPYLGQHTSWRGRLLLLGIAALTLLSLVAVVMVLMQPAAPDVIIVVPSPSPNPDSATAISLLAVPSLTPDLSSSPTTPIPTEETLLVMPTLVNSQRPTALPEWQSPTPAPSQTLTFPINGPRPGAHGVLLLQFEPNEATALLQTFKQAFPNGEVFAEVTGLPSSDAINAMTVNELLEYKAASVAIERTATGYTLYGRDFWQVYRNHPDLVGLMRWPSPWQLTLPDPDESLLIGVLGYVAYRPGVTIEKLGPLYEKPPLSALDDSQTLLAFMLAYSYQARGDADSAGELYDLLTTYISQQSPAIAANRAYAIAQDGNVQSAITLYGNVAGQDPAFIQSTIGDLYWELGQNPSAAQLAYEEALRLDPSAARPYVGRGRLLASLGDSQRALADFDQAIQLDPTYALAYYERAQVRFALDLRPEALRDVGLAISLQPQIAEYYLLQGQLLASDTAWSSVTTALEAALQMGAESPQVHALLGQAYYELGNLDGAIRESNAALGLAVDFAPAWFVRGQAYLAQNELGSALNDFNQGLSHDPQNAALLAARCAAHARLGDDGAAASDCDSALAVDGQNAAALEQRGMIRYRAGDRAGAGADFLEAVTYAPQQSYLAHYYLGFFALQEQRYPEAIAYLTESLSIAPYLGQAYAARGVAYRVLGQWELALADLEQALALMPEDLYSYYELGLVKRFLADLANDAGQNSQAARLYQEASAALLTFLNASQPQDPFVAEATQALAYVQNALAVLGQP
jgi:tetratricopeptide (TPR) repeat protein